MIIKTKNNRDIAYDLTNDTVRKYLLKVENHFSYETDDKSIIRWVQTLAKNTFIDYTRKIKERPIEDITTYEGKMEKPTTYNPTADSLWITCKHIVDKDYQEDKLDPMLYLIFLCRYIENLSNKKTARKLLITNKEAINLKRRLIRYLKKQPQIKTIISNEISNN